MLAAKLASEPDAELLARFAADRAVTPMEFREWVATRYDAAALMAEYRSGAVADFVADRVLGRE